MAPPGPAGGAIWLARPAWAADRRVARPTGKTTGQPWPCPGPRDRDRAEAGRQGQPLAGSPGRARGESVAASLLSLQARPPGRAPAAGLGGQEGLATVHCSTAVYCSVLYCRALVVPSGAVLVLPSVVRLLQYGESSVRVPAPEVSRRGIFSPLRFHLQPGICLHYFRMS